MALTELEKKIGLKIGSILDSEDYENVQKKDIADKLGIPNSNFSDKLAGKRRFHVDELCIIADTLGVSVDYLLGRSETKSVDPDMQAAVKALGLSQKAVENIADTSRLISKMHEDLGLHDTNSINILCESDYYRKFLNLWDEIAEQAARYYDYVRNNPYAESDGYDRSSMIELAIFRLLKLIESAAYSIYTPYVIAMKAEDDYNAAHNNEVISDGQENKI